MPVLSVTPEKWEKLGLILPNIGGSLGRTHAMLPTPWLMKDRLRIYVASCDEDLRGRIFYVDLDPELPLRVLNIGRRPILDLGEPNAFDADGVNPSQLIELDGKLLLYYVGWKRHSNPVPLSCCRFG